MAVYRSKSCMYWMLETFRPLRSEARSLVSILPFHLMISSSGSSMNSHDRVPFFVLASSSHTFWVSMPVR